MAFQVGTVMDKFIHKSALHWWRRAARLSREADHVTLRKFRYQARQLRGYLAEVIHAADEKLALPVVGSNAFPRPFGSDWAWRPELWRGSLAVPGISSVQTKSTLGHELTLFHDCDHSELTLRQVRNLREEDLAPYGLRMDVFRFDGSFLSLVLDLPEEAITGLRKEHLIRVDTIVEVEKPIEIFARLNIKHGPNTEQIVRELPLHEENVMVEFDLAYSNLNEKRVEKAWLDIIFEGPEMNMVTLRDITFSRRLRAAI
jgi:hypothetical protein